MRIEGIPPKSAHVIVLGNEKGGTGKSTTSMHLVVALLNAGMKVATIDLDGRQLSFTRYIENRKKWSASAGLNLAVPDHYAVPKAHGNNIEEIESREFAKFADAISRVEHSVDFIVVDTPGSDSYLMRLAHSMADTLITPMNDSFVDFDVLGHIDPRSGEVVESSHYAHMVADARRQRRVVDGGLTDWILVRNRLSILGSRNQVSITESLSSLSKKLGFRVADGISERVIFKELFPIGMTAMDELDEGTLGTRPTMSHVTARQEIRALVTSLRLPIDAKGRRRAEARRIWMSSVDKKIDTMGILAD
jgi:chromosome partitioning protein